MKSEHTEISWQRPLQPSIFKSGFNAREKKWNDKTLDEHISRIGKLEKLVSRTFGEVKYTDVKPPTRERKASTRNIKMSLEDLEKIRVDMVRTGWSDNGLKALEFTVRCGLRAKEVSYLKAENIDVENDILHVVERAKNGHRRDVNIRPQDCEYFTNLKVQVQRGYVCGGVKEDSLNHAVRRALERVGLAEKYTNTTEHSVRKLYATERYKDI